ASARLDDVMNWVPARLSTVVIAITTGTIHQISQARQDAKLHRSPNAGWPETAMALALGVSLAGPRSYDGCLQYFPWVNDRGLKDIGSAEIDQSILVLWRAWIGIVMLVLIAKVLLNLPGMI
ncbi:MAG: cobalamin biosynthesis protein, partial [Planktomarina sp.]